MRACACLVLMIVFVASLPQGVGSIIPGFINPATVELCVTCPEMEYTTGSVLRVQVEVFGGGAPLDPSVVNLSIYERPPDFGDSRSLNLTRQSTGLFVSDDRILAADIDSKGRIWLYAEGIWGGRELWDSCRVDTVYCEAFEVDAHLIDPEDSEPEPGQTIGLEIFTRFRGSPVEPSDLRNWYGSITGTIVPWQGFSRWDNVSVGHFMATVKAPQRIPFSFDCVVQANYTWDGVDLEALSHLTFYMRSYFLVWAHVVDMTTDVTLLDLHVTDDTGAPVSGAVVNITKRSSALGPGTLTNLTTDERGITTVELPLNWTGLEATFINGEVMLDGRSQGFIVHLVSPDDQTPTAPGVGGSVGFLRLVTRGPLEDDRNVTLELAASDGTDYFAGKDYVFNVEDYHRVYFNGIVRGDSAGHFVINFHIPDLRIPASENSEILIDYAPLGREGHSYRLFIRLVDTWTTPSKADPPVLGRLRVTKGGAPGLFDVALLDDTVDGLEEDVWVIWGVGIVRNDTHGLLGMVNGEGVPGLSEGRWGYLPQTEFGFEGFTEQAPVYLKRPCTWNGTCYVARLDVPAFLPAGADPFFIGVIADKATGETHLALENIPNVIDDGEPLAPTSGDGTITVTEIALLLLVMASVAVVFWILKRGRNPVE